jgi:hypothetical protein
LGLWWRWRFSRCDGSLFQGVDLAVERNGHEIALAAADESRFKAMINQVVEDALANKLEALTPEQLDAEWRELAAYGAQKAVAAGITSDEDVDRLVNQYRHAQQAAR